MTEALFIKKLGALRPADPASEDTLQRVKDGELIKVQWSRPRNGRALNLYWSLCGLVHENSSYSAEEVSDLIKLGTGHYTTLAIPGPRPGDIPTLHRRPKSIAFAAMDRDEFDKFLSAAIDFILARILPGTGKQDLVREVYERIGIPMEVR